MSSHGGEPPPTAHPSAHGRAAINAWIVLASILCGVGLFMVWYWLTFFNWWWFSGVGLVLAGALIFFKTWSGPESAE